MDNRGLRRTHPAPGFFQGEKWFVWTGLLGFLLAGWCGAWVVLKGGAVAPDGNVAGAFSFNAALGIFMLSTAAIVPFSGMGARSRAVFRWTYIMLALYSYGMETIQQFRGVNPRFPKTGAMLDITFSGIFALVALLLLLSYVAFAVQFFRSKAPKGRPELLLSIRYAMIATAISFAAGIWMSTGEGRFTGLHGNIIWLHGLGFHALQALPFAAWLAESTSLPAAMRRRFVHLIGILYLCGLVAIGWQTMLGRTVLEWSWLPLIAGGCFLAGIVLGAAVFRRALLERKAQRPRTAPGILTGEVKRVRRSV